LVVRRESEVNPQRTGNASSSASPGCSSRSRATGGAGLGLPIARELARAHGGDLVYLDGTVGASFQVRIPAAS